MYICIYIYIHIYVWRGKSSSRLNKMVGHQEIRGVSTVDQTFQNERSVIEWVFELGSLSCLELGSLLCLMLELRSSSFLNCAKLEVRTKKLDR